MVFMTRSKASRRHLLQLLSTERVDVAVISRHNTKVADVFAEQRQHRTVFNSLRQT